MRPDWEDLERTVRNMEERYKRTRARMYHSERKEMENDINKIRKIARVERDSYVSWLYTGRR